MKASISTTSHYAPKKTLTNLDLEKIIETFLSIDKESNTIILSEVNSALEESRRFKEFKDKYIDQYQTYEEEIRYGKNRRRYCLDVFFNKRCKISHYLI